MSQYFFPVLSLEEILDNWDFVKKTDYEKPECTRWYKIYSLMFESITGVKLETVEEKAMLTFSRILDVEHPELFEDSSHVIWFTIALQRALITCGVQDFTFKDIRDPRPKRLLVISSACINFLRYKSSRDTLIQEVLENVESKKINQRDTIKTNEELHKKLDAALQIRAQREPEMTTLNKNSEELKEKIGAMKAESLELHEAIAELRAKTTEIRALKAQKKCDIVRSKQDCERLHHNIVQSPEKARERMQCMRERVERMKEETQQGKVNTLSTLTSKLAHMKSSESMQEQTLRILHTMEEDIKKQEEIKNEIKAAMEASVVNSMKLKAFQLQENELVESLSLIQERHQKLQIQKRIRLTDFDARYTELVEQKKTLRDALKKALLKKEDMSNEKQALLDEMKDAWASTNTKTNAVVKNYSDILEELNKYHLFLTKNLCLS